MKKEQSEQDLLNDGNESNLGLAQLTFLAISTTLASGVFSISGDFAQVGAYPLATLIGWLITGVGMLGLMMVFFKLTLIKPNLTSGIYAYAEAGFGEYMGFNSAWGYWLGVILSSISFAVLLFDTLGGIFPAFGDGSSFAFILASTAIIWVFALIVLRGIDEAATINIVVVIAKTVPILLFVVLVLLSRQFSFDIFFANFLGEGSGLSLGDQVRATTYVTLWVFIGIEGAVVTSGRGKTTEIAGQATLISFISLLALYLMISIMSMGIMPTEELAALPNPSMGGVLEQVVGPWGATLVNVGVLISLVGAMFSYTILNAECLTGPARDGAFPVIFTKKNKNGVEYWSVIVSTLASQLFLIVVYFSDTTYQAAYAASTSLIIIPYALSAFYYLQLVISGEAFEKDEKSSKLSVWLFVILGCLYSLWMIYGSGLEYILLGAILYAPGLLIYIYHRKSQNKPLFNKTYEMVIAAVIVVGAILLFTMVMNGALKLF